MGKTTLALQALPCHSVRPGRAGRRTVLQDIDGPGCQQHENQQRDESLEHHQQLGPPGAPLCTRS